MSRSSAGANLALAMIVILAGCGRVPVSVAPTPSSEASRSPIPESPQSAASPPRVVVTPRPSTVASPSTAPRPSPSQPPPPPRLAINPFSLRVGEIRIQYPAVNLGATGGKPPYSWSLSSGVMPGGINLSAAGGISGTPTAPGPFSFTVQVRDAAGTTVGNGASITIAPYLSVSGICSSTPCQVEARCVTVCGALGSLSGGVGPYIYTPNGTLPPGMGLSGLALTGAFPVGSYKFGVGVTDALGATGFIAAAFDVFAHIGFTVKGTTCRGTATAGCGAGLSYGGGTPGGTPKVTVNVGTAPPLPKGFSAVAKGGVVYVTFPAQLSAKYSYSGTITLTLTDQSLCGPSPGQLCTSGRASLAITITPG